jgi:hypothetical protein
MPDSESRRALWDAAAERYRDVVRAEQETANATARLFASAEASTEATAVAEERVILMQALDRAAWANNEELRDKAAVSALQLREKVAALTR